VDGALPAPLLQALQLGFRPAATFWHQHGYFEQQTPFFSYLYALGQQPSNAVEQSIAWLHQRLAGEGSAVAGAACAEWWAHCRRPHEPHQLHFDVNEALLRQASTRGLSRRGAGCCSGARRLRRLLLGAACWGCGGVQ
jgi:hypothetical protein